MKAAPKKTAAKRARPPAVKNQPPMSTPLVSVIIPHYNDLANLERCLTFLAAQTLPKSQFEVIVADNNSRCGIEEVRRVCGDFARVIPAPTPVAGPARNVAVEPSRGRYLAVTDQDCRPPPNWLERTPLTRPRSRHSSAFSLSTSGGTSRNWVSRPLRTCSFRVGSLITSAVSGQGGPTI
jgi:glycosyltransferase involved in cell wall biosynthesis